MITVQIEGLDRWRGVAAVAQMLPEVVHFASRDWVQVVYEESQKIVPVFSGDLKASGRIEDVSDNRQIDMSLIYGGGSVRYALLIHEDLTIHHPEHVWRGIAYNCGGDAKYASLPWTQNRPSLTNALVEGIKGIFQ